MIGRVQTGLLAAAIVVLVVFVLGLASRPDPRTVLREYGWSPEMWETQGRVTIGTGPGWDEALAASKSVGLDFSGLWGAAAVEQVYDVGPIGATLLLVNEQLVGAWLNLPGSPHYTAVPLDHPVERVQAHPTS